MLRGVVYMLKRIGRRTEPLCTLHERGYEGDAKPETRTEKERDAKYVLNHLRAESAIPNQDERRWRRIELCIPFIDHVLFVKF